MIGKDLEELFYTVVIASFTAIFYGETKGPWSGAKYLGIPVWQNPMDMWVYQELLWQVKPELVIETGTGGGGRALYLAHILKAIGEGRVITVDLHAFKESVPAYKEGRIRFLLGSSVEPAIVDKMDDAVKSAKSVMVFLDSDHHKDHVLKELEIYSKFVTVGSYLVVEDTNNTGPAGAVEEWLPKHPEFEIDKECEKYLLTFHPNGWLQRVK